MSFVTKRTWLDKLDGGGNREKPISAHFGPNLLRNDLRGKLDIMGVDPIFSIVCHFLLNIGPIVLKLVPGPTPCWCLGLSNVEHRSVPLLDILT